MSSAIPLLRDVLNRNTCQLELVKEQVLKTRSLYDDAQVALEEAQSRLDILARERDHLLRLEVTLNQAQAASRSALVREAVAAMPPEVLSHIFRDVDEAADPRWTHDEWWSGIDQGVLVYSKNRAEAPFILSAVCIKWRKIVLNDGHLWKYISAPMVSTSKDQPCNATHLARIHLCLERSKGSPLHVAFDWRAASGSFTELCAALTKNAHRFERCVLVAVQTVMDPAVLEIFRCQTPALTRLYLMMNQNTGVSTTTYGGFLPFAPKLSNVLIRVPASFPSLRVCSGWWEAVSFTLDLAGHATQTLQHLSLRSVTDTAIHYNSISFPRLQSLMVSGRWCFGANPTTVNVPSLTHFGCQNFSVAQAAGFDRFAESASETITHLTLGTFPADIDDLRALSKLKHVTHLTIGMRYVDQWAKYTVSDASLASLCDVQPTVWPHLTRISFESVGSVNPPDAPNLLRLVHMRSGQVSAQPGGHAGNNPATINQVDLNYIGAPVWLKQQLEQILAARREK
ncbi:hypothetical protein BKA62DRAFT_720772 [Auriculariales sp. MPI-PUGE-AT-0066]|nr:hypothetical protein BKA62DRAFT_720772 [Auriculariales sp. MPI-PUGE-AT-0066]